jgi:hypothetical protein
MRTVTVPDNVVTGKAFTPEEWVALVGCGLTLEQYREIVLKLATYTHQGTHDRGKEQDATGRWLPAPIHPETGQALQEENPADEVEIKFKKLLRTSLLLHINQAHCLNRWPQPGEFESVESYPMEFPRELLDTEANPDFVRRPVQAAVNSVEEIQNPKSAI